MLTAWTLAAALAATGNAVPTPSAPQAPAPAEATTALSPEQRAIKLVEGIVRVCEAHPEVERAFVSDAALAEADAVYRELFPGRGYMEVMLLTRSTWKEMLGGVPPVYLRPKR